MLKIPEMKEQTLNFPGRVFDFHAVAVFGAAGPCEDVLGCKQTIQGRDLRTRIPCQRAPENPYLVF